MPTPKEAFFIGVEPKLVPAPAGKNMRTTPIYQQSLMNRFIYVLLKSATFMDDALAEQWTSFCSPANLAIMAGTLVVYAANQVWPGGWCLTILIGAGLLTMGIATVCAVSSLLSELLSLVVYPTSDSDIDKASELFANIVLIVGITVVIGWLCRKASFPVKVSGVVAEGGIAVTARQSAAAIANKAGMSAEHFAMMQRLADELGLVIGVRNTNPKSTWLIQWGAPAKPFKMNSHTSPETGVVTVVNSAQKAEALNHIDGVYYVVERIGAKLIPKNLAGKELVFEIEPIWELAEGQVINGRLKLPVVGDYDLAAVIDPSAMTRNLALVANGGEICSQWGNPVLLNRVISAFNTRAGMSRLMHFAHEGFATIESAGTTTWFTPKAPALEMTAAESAAWYSALGRKPIVMPPEVLKTLKASKSK